MAGAIPAIPAPVENPLLQTLSRKEKAHGLATQGRIVEALSVLNDGISAGDADACFLLATWTFSGQIVARNLKIAAELFAKAAENGHPAAEDIHIALLANSAGGQRDWSRAIHLLERKAGRDPAAAQQLAILSAIALDTNGDPHELPSFERLSERPDIVLFPNFLSPEECAYLRETARPHFQSSVVVHPFTGQRFQHPIRTSDTAIFPLAFENPAIHALNRRMAAASRTRPEQGEPLQILRYSPGQEYRLHSDALAGEANQRTLTMLIYLNDAFEGGETAFPAANIHVRGRQGDAILFRNIGEDGLPDPLARHAGKPVFKGTKFVASRWIRRQPLDLTSPSSR
ncbi:MAG TPA: 2OG-Fe(II) oxygenase [Allosphingosinicella sp.]